MDIKDRMVEGFKEYVKLYLDSHGALITYFGSLIPQHQGIHVTADFFAKNFPKCERINFHSDGETVTAYARYKETQFYCVTTKAMLDTLWQPGKAR